MGNVWAIACLTLKECIRRKVLIVAGLAALVIISSIFFPIAGSTKAEGWDAESGAGDRLRLMETWSIYSITFFGVLLSIFLAASDLPRDIEFKTIFNILTKPVRHSQYLAGKILGFCLTVGLVLAILAALSFTLITITSLTVPTHELAEPLTPSDRCAPVQCHIAPRGENIASGLGSGDYWLFAPAEMKLELLFHNVNATIPGVEPYQGRDDVASVPPEQVTVVAQIGLIKPGGTLSEPLEGTREVLVKLRAGALSGGDLPETVDAADGDEMRIEFSTEKHKSRLVSRDTGLARVAIAGKFKDGFLVLKRSSVKVVTPNGEYTPFAAQVIPNDGDEVIAGEPGRIKVAYLFTDLEPGGDQASFRVRLAMLNYEDAQRRYDITLAAVSIADPSQRKEVLLEKLSNGHWAYFAFPSSLISPDGQIVIEVASDPGNYYLGLPSGMVLFGEEQPAGEREMAKVSLSVKFHPFALNFLKSMLLLFLSFVLMIFIGVAGSTFLSGPVSITLALFIYFCGSLTEQISKIVDTLRHSPEMGFLGMATEAIERGSPMSGIADRFNQFASVLIEGLLRILPDFRVFGTRQLLVGAANIPAAQVLAACRVFVIWALGAYILGYLVFRLKEVAK